MGDKEPLLYATTNQGKLREVKTLARQIGLQVIGLDEVARPSPPPEVEESGSTYEENSFIKADAYFNWSGQLTLADDAGLEVTALRGAPGVFSARFGGADISWEERRALLLKMLGGAKDRSARFVCVLTLVGIGEEPIFARGELRGRIAEAPRGDQGFGYDSLFVVEGLDRTLAEMKGGYVVVETHRKRAVELMLKKLEGNNRGN